MKTKTKRSKKFRFQKKEGHEKMINGSKANEMYNCPRTKFSSVSISRFV